MVGDAGTVLNHTKQQNILPYVVNHFASRSVCLNFRAASNAKFIITAETSERNDTHFWDNESVVVLFVRDFCRITQLFSTSD